MGLIVLKERPKVNESFPLRPGILRCIRQALRPVVRNIAHTQELEYFEEGFAHMAECHSTVMREMFLDQYMAVEDRKSVV